jgi:electron transport complex protein RnfG
MREMVKPIIVLFLICFVMTLLLSITYNFTKDAIVARAAEELEAAKKAVLPGAREFREADIETAKAENEGLGTVTAGFEGYVGDLLKGYVFSIVEKGYGGEVYVNVGIDTNGTVTGINIGDNNETPGLGKKIENPKFLQRFIGIKPDGAVTIVRSPSNANGEVEGIAGATVSSKVVARAVTAAVNMSKVLQGEEIDGSTGATTDGTSGATGGE